MSTLYVLFISLFLGLNACKSVPSKFKQRSTTKAPVAHTTASSASKLDAPASKSTPTTEGQVRGSTSVSTDEVPQLTITIDLNLCVGVGKWLDPKAEGGPNPWSISVDLQPEMPNPQNRPMPWIVEPNGIPKDGESPKTIHVNSWRLNQGSYTAEIIVFKVATGDQDSKISKKFDFNATHELTMEVVGVWLPTNVCELRWKAETPAAVVP